MAKAKQDLEKIASSIVVPLRDDAFEDHEVTPYLLDEFRDCRALVKYLDPDFKAANKEEMTIANILYRHIRPKKRAKLWSKLVIDANPHFDKKLPVKHRPEMDEYEPDGELCLVICSPLGNKMLWGKTYGKDVPIIQMDFFDDQIVPVCRFLRKLGFKIVDRRS